MRWGPRQLDEDRTEFALWAPSAARVELVLDGAGEVAMDKRDAGWFATTERVAPGSRYRFRLPDAPGGGLDVPDPASRLQDGGVHGWSVVCAPDDHDWRAADWRGQPWEETVIWECHAGVLGGFNGVAERLDELAGLGITAVELMPVGAFSGNRGWGYDGVLPYAPHEAYGSPAELKALVDRAHELGLSMILDVVYNHFGPDGNYLGAYASDFFHGAHTPWGQAVSVNREPVARFFIDNALMWLTEYRFDGLRFDAVHAIGDEAFLDRMGREIRAATKGRQVHLVLENEANDTEPLEGPYDAQWNDDFHNALHVLLTGESDSYYAAFADAPAKRLARIMAEGFSYQGEEIEPGRRRGKPSAHLPATCFVNFLQNHDQVGNRAMGERLIRLVGEATLKAATAVQLLSPGIPLLFMGEEAGSRTPFLFFTDFHDDLADAVREGRRREFSGFPAFSDPEAREAIPDPNDPATFAASRPEPGPDGEEWRRFYRDLLALRARHLVPHLAGCESLGAEPLGDRAIRGSWQLGDGARWHVLGRFGDEPLDTPKLPGRTIFAAGMAERGPFAFVTCEEA